MTVPSVYHFDAHGCYVGESPARIDPLETIATGQNVYLLPAHSTFIKPTGPALNAHESLFFNGSVWGVIADYRGMTAYLQVEPYTVEIVKVPGPLANGWSLEPPTRTE